MYLLPDYPKFVRIFMVILGLGFSWLMFGVQFWPGLMTLKMENTMFAKMESLEHSTKLIH
jgi:hypothetical protein